MPDDQPPARTIRIDLPMEADEDLRLLRGALLSAKATELAEIHRRDFRMSTGYGTDAAHEGMNAEMAQRRRRIELLDRLLAALDGAGPEPPT
jgi:hypothetical protein